MYVCMYVCVYVYGYACMHVSTYACMHFEGNSAKCMHTFEGNSAKCIHTCMYVCILCMNTIYVCMHVCLYVAMRLHVYMHVDNPYIPISVCMCVHVWGCVSIIFKQLARCSFTFDHIHRTKQD